MRHELSSFTIGTGATLRDAAACIDVGGCGIAVVVDGHGRLVDTITDGDIRRSVLAGRHLQATVEELRHRRVGTPYETPVFASIDDDDAALLSILRARCLRQLPLVDADGVVRDLVTIDDLVVGNASMGVHAVVMAGGFGTRLGDLTKNTPKPMLPVGDKPLLEHIVGQLRAAGITTMSVTTHYRAEQIEEHFGDGRDFGVDIQYVAEDRPLGTAGALGLLPPPTMPLLVMNGDILTRIDIDAMLRFHREHAAELTVAVRQYEMAVPFGVVEADGPLVSAIKEKPQVGFLVNAGIYLIEPSVLPLVPAGARLDMPDLITALLSQQRRVASFPVLEYWLDIGRVEDYSRARSDVADWQGKAQPPT
ncbi:MAG TPA: nucleotidyltransferase family protein [Myxococcota bacterium]